MNICNRFLPLLSSKTGLPIGRACSFTNHYSSGNTWKRVVPSPIQVFSVEDFGIKKENFLNEHTPVFKVLPPDEYDAKIEKIEFLLTHSPKFALSNEIAEYYAGSVSSDIMDRYCEELSPELRVKFDAIKPYRYRAISQFRVKFSNGQPYIERIPIAPFVQEEAMVQEANRFDYRKWPRKFQNLSEDAALLPTFQKALVGIADKIHDLYTTIREISIIAHHVRVVTNIDRPVSNSPEGIHQDGFPFIVSALVVERERVTGGKSIIYGEDKTTKLLTTELSPGMGILQPDLGSGLWHSVTKIHVDKTKYPNATDGFRNTIGFDIKPII